MPDSLLNDDSDDDYVTCNSCDTILHIDDAYLGSYGYACESCDEASDFD